MEPLNYRLNGIQEMSFDPRALVQMKADSLNAAPGELKGYNCPKCRNRGYVARVDSDNRLVTAPCGCISIRRTMAQAEHSGMKGLLQKTFDSFQVTHPWQQRMLEHCRQYAADPVGWLALCGQSGSGKTHLCAAACNALLRDGYEVRYFSWREHIVQLKGLAGDYDRQQALMQEFKNARVLYIDDLFKCGGIPTPADISLGFELLNCRYLSGLPTVISTELLPRQLGELDVAMGSRILELAKNHLVVIEPDNRKNFRLTGHK